MIGQTIDRYLLIEKIGSGGMGDVYKARHTSLEQYRAIKILPPYLSTRQELVDRFFREARRCAALNHPHIVRLEHVGEQDGLYYMVMDYVDGPSLRELLDERAPLAPVQAARIARDVCRALEYAHERGVIHRDIKPSNILLTRDRRAVLTDFGIARGLEGDEPGLTSVGAVIGTPEYMSPEQVRGEALDSRTDLYSLGVVLYEMCTGEVPFSARSSSGVRRLQAERAPEPPSFFNPTLPPAFDALIMRALAKNPAERFAGAAEMSRALDAALQAEARERELQGPGVLDAYGEGAPLTDAVGAGSARGRAGTGEHGRLGGAVEAPEKPGARRQPTQVDGADPAAGREAVVDRPVERPRRESPGNNGGNGSYERPTLIPGVAEDDHGRRLPGEDRPRSAPYPNLPRALDRFGSRRWIAAVLLAALVVLLVGIVLQTLGGSAWPRFSAEKGWDPRNGREYGTVLANGIPVFIVTAPEGDLTPSQRAERAAERLREIEESHSGQHHLDPDMIVAMNTARGETVLAHRHHNQHGNEPDPDDVIVNVDDTTARTYAGVSRMALAAWWRDLLRDEIRLSHGREPVSTYDTPTGKILDRLYQQLGDPGRHGSVSPAELKKALDDLPEADRTALRNAWRMVPANRRAVVLGGMADGSAMLPRRSATATDSAPGHPVRYAIDGSLNTTWDSRRGFRYRGRLHGLRINLSRQATVSGVEVVPGMEGWPGRELRIRRMRIVFPDGSAVQFTRNASTDPLLATFPARRASWVKLLVDEVFPNNRAWDAHLSVAEVRVWGR